MSCRLFLEPEVSESGDVVNKQSTYQGTDRELQRRIEVRCMFSVAQDTRDQAYEEFDNRDFTTVLNEGQNLFNANTPAPSSDPDDAWKANTKRPITRNKLVNISSEVLANLLFPAITAQNEDAEEDRDASLIASDLMDYQLEQLQYPRLMKKAVIASMYSPATFVGMDYVDNKREVKEIKDDGSWELKEVEDDLFGGFQSQVIPSDEIYPTNIYEPDLQKQIIIRRQIIDYNAAKQVYRDRKNWEHVVPGIRIFFYEQDNLFFEQYDESQQERLVELVTYYDPFADLELEYINGIPMNDPDQPLRRKDKLIPIIKTGYELINERFFYYKSGAEKLMNDDLLLNDMWNMVMDGSALATMPPTSIFGSEDIDASIMIPGMTTVFANPEAKVQSISPDFNLVAGFNAVGELERSLSESSVSPQSQGVPARGVNTAFEVATLEQNARRNLGLFILQIGELVEDFGDMLLPLILQHQTVGDAVQTMGDTNRLRFSSVLVEERQVGDEIKSRRIDFDEEVPPEVFGEEVTDFEFDMMKEEDLKDVAIAKVIPGTFRDLKFKVKVNLDPLSGRTEAVKKALRQEAYNLIVSNPFGNQETALRDFVIEPVAPGESQKYMSDPTPTGEGDAALGGAEGQLINSLTQGGELGPAAPPTPQTVAA